MSRTSVISLVYALANFGLGALCVGIQIRALSGGNSPPEWFGVVLTAGLLFFVGCAGFALRSRWLVILPALPLLLFLVVWTAAIAVGGWIWGPGNAATVYFLVFLGSALIVFELSGIIFIRKLDPPEGRH